MLKQTKSWIRLFVRSHTRTYWALFWTETHPPAKYWGNAFSSFCVILPTNQRKLGKWPPKVFGLPRYQTAWEALNLVKPLVFVLPGSSYLRPSPSARRCGWWSSWRSRSSSLSRCSAPSCRKHEEATRRFTNEHHNSTNDFIWKQTQPG